MPEYRLYFLDRRGHIARPAKVVDCADDTEVIAKARQIVDGESIEVWEGTRVVGQINTTH